MRLILGLSVGLKNFVPVFLYAVICSFFRLKEFFQVKNGLTTSLRFFFSFLKMPKIWVGRRR